MAQQFTQGNITTTNNPLDIAINGGGFFIVSQAGTNAPYYSRNGQFSLDSLGNIVNNEGYRVQGYPVDSAGVVQVGSAPTDLLISRSKISPLATGASAAAVGVEAKLNLDSRASVISAPFDYTNPSTYTRSTALSVYDSLGSPSTYTMYFVKTGVNTWDVHATLTNPAGVITDEGSLGPITFSTSGALLTAMPLSESIPAADLGTGAATLTFNVNFSNTTQYGSGFAVNSLAQDGYSSGELVGFNVSADGVIKGAYTNGQSKNLGQIALANFTNPQGLQPQGNNRWAATSASGAVLINQPGSGGNGMIQSAATEDSNVDLTAELVNMITAQRVYQANAQSIKTQDAVMQTLVNLR